MKAVFCPNLHPWELAAGEWTWGVRAGKQTPWICLPTGELVLLDPRWVWHVQDNDLTVCPSIKTDGAQAWHGHISGGKFIPVEEK